MADTPYISRASRHPVHVTWDLGVYFHIYAGWAPPDSKMLSEAPPASCCSRSACVPCGSVGAAITVKHTILYSNKESHTRGKYPEYCPTLASRQLATAKRSRAAKTVGGWLSKCSAPLLARRLVFSPWGACKMRWALARGLPCAWSLSTVAMSSGRQSWVG